MAFRKVEVKPNIDLTESGLYHEKDYIGTNSGSIIDIVKDNLFFKEQPSKIESAFCISKIDLIKSKLKNDYSINDISILRNRNQKLIGCFNNSIFRILECNNSQEQFKNTCVRCGKLILKINQAEVCDSCKIKTKESMMDSWTFPRILITKAKK